MLDVCYKYNTMANNKLDKDIFKNHEDYWLVAENIKNLYLSEGSLLTLLDFERVLDDLDLYAFKNWSLGELVSGPDIGKYKVGCIFMWPEKLMPDPRGARRLLPFDCEVKFKKTRIKIPVKIEEPDVDVEKRLLPVNAETSADSAAVLFAVGAPSRVAVV